MHLTRRISHAESPRISPRVGFGQRHGDDKVPAAELEKVQATLTALGCTGYEEIKKEEQGIYEIDDAKCNMGTVDIKLDKDYTVILISRY